LQSLNQKQKKQLIEALDESDRRFLASDWELEARRDQLEPEGNWRFWVKRSGRGGGKTRTGSEWIHKRAYEYPNERILLVGQTLSDVYHTMLEEEDSSLFNTQKYWNPCRYAEGSKKRIIVWENGARAQIFSGDKPGQMRGQNSHTIWMDEWAKFQYPKRTFTNLNLGLRKGPKPQMLITTTPRPLPEMIDLLKRENCIDSPGSTYDNIENLSPEFIAEVNAEYKGTRLGQQEIYGELLTDTPGALWTYADIPIVPYNMFSIDICKRIVIGVDPGGSSKKVKPQDENKASKTGIVICGTDGGNNHFVIEDLSKRAKPEDWAKIAIGAYDNFKADCVVVEDNYGGEMTESNIKQTAKILYERKQRKSSYINVKPVNARRGKYLRAEPIASQYTQGKVRHVKRLPNLEMKMTTYVPGEPSPDELDAMVHAMTELVEGVRLTSLGEAL
jgi:phage terminase large subunit-like protein